MINIGSFLHGHLQSRTEKFGAQVWNEQPRNRLSLFYQAVRLNQFLHALQIWTSADLNLHGQLLGGLLRIFGRACLELEGRSGFGWGECVDKHEANRGLRTATLRVA